MRVIQMSTRQHTISILALLFIITASSLAQSITRPISEAKKKILVFNLNVPDANQSTSEKVTVLLSDEMKKQSGIVVSSLTDLKEKLVELGLENQALECKTLECAVDIAGRLDYSFSLFGDLTRLGAGYDLNISLADNQRKIVVLSQSDKFRQGKREALRYLPSWGSKIARLVAHPNFPQDFRDPTQAGEGKAEAGKSGNTAQGSQSNSGVRGWLSDTFDPNTAHLKGTRISGVWRDSLLQAQSPYIVTDNLLIPADADVVIEPGVTIYIGGHYTTITVSGMLRAQGNQAQPILIKSGKVEPAAWDWDRIVFKGPRRSLLEYVTIENSNNGVYVKNSSLTLSHCTLTHNSLRAAYAEQGDLEIKDSKILDRHLIAVQVGPFANVQISRTRITDNHNGISVMEYGTLSLQHSVIEANDRGLILDDSVSLSLENTNIQQNRIGVLSLFDSPENRKLRRSQLIGLKGNKVNLELAPREKFTELMQAPAEVKEERSLKFGSSATTRSNRFEPGVKSIRPGGSSGSGIYGNSSIGLEYHLPETAENTTARGYPVGEDTIPVGEKFPQKKVIEGLYTLVSAYTTVEDGPYVVDANLDLRHDEWGDFKIDALTLKTQMGAHRLALGDITESGSEISLSSKSLFGARYQAELLPDRSGRGKFGYSASFGESVKPFDVGDRNPDAFGEYYQPNSAIAQELVGLGRVSFYPNKDWNLNVNYIHSQDSRSGLLRPSIQTTSVTSEPPLVSNMLGLESQWTLLDGALTLSAELNVGTVDSVNSAFNRAIKGWAAVNGQSENSALEQVLQPTVSNGYLDSNLAAAFPITDDSLHLDSVLAGNKTQVEANLKALRLQIRDSILQEVNALEPGIQDSLDESKTMGFRFEDQGMASRLGFKLDVNGMVIDGEMTYVGAYYFTGGNPFLTRDQRHYQLSTSRDLSEKLNMSAGYDLISEHASSEGQYLNLFGFGEGTDLGFIPDENIQLARESVSDRPKFTNNWNVKGRYNLSSLIELNFDYGLTYKLEVKNKALKKDTSVYVDGVFAPRGGNTTNSVVYDNRSYQIDSAAYASLQSLDTLARIQDDNDLTNKFGLKAKLRFSKLGYFEMGGKWSLINNQLSFRHSQVLDILNLSDSTLENLGYFPDGDDQFQQDYSLALQLNWKEIQNKIEYKFGWKDRVSRDQNSFEWSVSDQVKLEIIPRKFRMGLNFRLRKKLQSEDAKKYYYEDSAGQVFSYYDQNGKASTLNDATTKEIELGQPDSLSGEIHSRSIRKELHETDYNIEVTARYNLNSKFYLEGFIRKEWYLRPDQLEQEYYDLATQVKLFYSF